MHNQLIFKGESTNLSEFLDTSLYFTLVLEIITLNQGGLINLGTVLSCANHPIKNQKEGKFKGCVTSKIVIVSFA